jgi:hypothetical protein
LPGQLAVDGREDNRAGPGGDEPLAESSEGGTVGDLAAVAQADEALETEAIEPLKLHLFVAEVVPLL